MRYNKNINFGQKKDSRKELVERKQTNRKIRKE